MANFPIAELKTQQTPFYFYDTELLQKTLNEINHQAAYPGFKVHYAVKANANPKILKIIRASALGIDCVSGGEIQAALNAGFEPGKIVFAGVGKNDWEIELGLKYDIACFNVESFPELEIIQELASKCGRVARIALRVNPNIDAHTHRYITTGLNENKFGISLDFLDDIIAKAQAMPNIKLMGLHFHIGSQITRTTPFKMLCDKVNELQDKYEAQNLFFKTINVGGGLGIDYDDPDANPIPAFETYFKTFRDHLKLRNAQELHFELGRSVVAQCGTLITRVLYVKEGINKKFAIVDAGLTELIRPALYQAHHKIENLTSDKPVEKYDVVGPICESSDCFGTDELLNGVSRGDILVLRSAGAYGEIMASQYNCRRLPSSYFK